MIDMHLDQPFLTRQGQQALHPGARDTKLAGDLILSAPPYIGKPGCARCLVQSLLKLVHVIASFPLVICAKDHRKPAGNAQRPPFMTGVLACMTPVPRRATLACNPAPQHDRRDHGT